MLYEPTDVSSLRTVKTIRTKDKMLVDRLKETKMRNYSVCV